MNLSDNNFPGTSAPQAQLIRLRKKLTRLSDQLTILSARAQMSNDEKAKGLLARATSNTLTALSFSDAVENITNQSALDLLTTPENSVNVNVALTAFEDVPDTNNLKPIARQIAPVVLDEKLPASHVKSAGALQTDQPRRFTCCSPDPGKWFGDNCASDQSTPSAPAPQTTTSGVNTCDEPSYYALTLPVHINSSKERVDELLALTDALVTAAKGQLGQARESICHTNGSDTCALF